MNLCCSCICTYLFYICHWHCISYLANTIIFFCLGQALSIAREALLIRTRFLHKKFIYFDQIRVSEEESDGNQNHLRLEVSSLAATEVWPRATQSQDSEQSVLSSWNVLKCYLESCFQVDTLLPSIKTSF